MKTKNAFAFHNFDSSRILQRPFFKDFYFASDKSDVEILESLNKVTEDSTDTWERNLYVIKAIHERLTKFRHLIDRHNKKKFTAKKVTIELIPYDSKKITPFGAFYFV